MRTLTSPGVHAIPYFALCRALGVRAVDDMVRARVLELRWMDTVTPEWDPDSRAWRLQDSVLGSDGGAEEHGKIAEAVGPKLVPTTPVVRHAMREVLKEYDIVEESGNASRRASRVSRDSRGDDKSDYASLSDVDEY